MEKHRLNILISPLDWGLGHATRCIPIIRNFIENGHNVYIAASGLSMKLLQSNFINTVQYLNVPGYNVQYAKNSKYFYWQMFRQLPHIVRTIRKEHELLKKWEKSIGFDLIISDNRYGLYSDSCMSIFMTHQYQIQSGWGKMIDKFLLLWHEQRMKGFQKVCIVDDEKYPLAPKLSAISIKKNIDVKYIGWLSQLVKVENQFIEKNKTKKILCLLSGPEPSRSQLLNLLLSQAQMLTQYEFTFITGAEKDDKDKNCKHVELLGLSTKDLVKDKMLEADLIVCRSGYSTIMDLVQLNKNALLIPTPGQEEQLYLAKYLKEKKVFHFNDQSRLNLQNDIQEAFQFPGFIETNLEVNIQAINYFNEILYSISRK